GFQFNESLFEKYPLEEIGSLRIVNLLPEPRINAQAFSSQIKFKLQHKEGGDPCHITTFIIRGSKDVYMMDLGIKGCAGKFQVYLGGVNVSGENTNLSNLGFEINQWTDVILRKQGSKVWLSVNGNELLIAENVPEIGKIGGIDLYAQQGIEIQVMEMKDEFQTIDLLY
ncbi:MAG: hypothetical protein AAF705_04995, partial [Bacteroidota bacterium]